MPSADAHVDTIFSAAVACPGSTAAIGPATSTAVCAWRSIWRAGGNARLLAFGRNRDTCSQIPLGRDDGCGGAGGGGGGDKCWGGFIGFGCGFIRGGVFSTGLCVGCE